MKYSLLLLLIILPGVLQAQNKVLSKIPATGASIEMFIPKGYDTISTAKGDLNKDGAEDIVLALRNVNEDTFEMDKEPVRVLIVLLKGKNTYSLGGKSSKVLMCRHCGGMWGDPFADISVTKGVLEIIHYGGSAWRWDERLKFKFQNGAFYLIGSTSDYYWNVHPCNGDEIGDSGRKYRDTNWITGDEEIIERDEDCKLIKHLKHRLKRSPSVKLENFKYDYQ